MEKKLSIDSFPLFETSRQVNTPLSLEACKREGVSPIELLYRPQEHYSSLDPSPEVQSLYFNFFEKKRRQLIKAVKNTHRSLLKSKNKSRLGTSSLSNREFSIVSEHQKLKDHTMKSISKVLSHEALCTNEMKKNFNLYRTSLKANEEKIRIRSKIEKQKFDKKRMKEEEKNRMQAEKLKEEKKKTGSKFKNSTYDKEIENCLSDQKCKEIDKKKEKKAKEIEEHLKRMKEHLNAIIEKKEKNLRKKEEKERERKKIIERQMATCREFYTERSNKKKQKIFQSSKKLEEELMWRKKMFEKKKNEEDWKCSEFIKSENEKLKEKFKNKSEERFRKTENARKFSEALLSYKRKKYDEKNENLHDRLRTREENLRVKEAYRNHKELLKQLNKDYNIMRLQKCREYYENALKEKMKEDEERVRNLKENKESYEKMRNQISHEDIIDREKLEEVVYKLKISKNWNLKPVKKLIAYSSNKGSVQSID